MFRGEHDHTMDGKGRVSLPAKFRETLSTLDPEWESSQKVILTRSHRKCLVLYPMKKWLSFEAKILEESEFNPKIQLLKMVYIAGALEIQVDSHGRLLIPQKLRDFAGLGGKVVWVGQLETAELWPADRYYQVLDELMDKNEELAKMMAELGL